MVRKMIDDCYETMPWQLIDNVVFDVGNVLLSFDPQTILDELVPEAAALFPRLMSKVFKSPYWVMLDHGLVTCEEAAELMIGRDTELAPYIRRIMSGWVEMKHVLPEGLFALESCKAHGKKLYVLSNYGDLPFQHVDEKYDFFRLFDGKLISSRVKLMKPNRTIYDVLADTYALLPERTLFIDDAPANIEAALHAGWQGFCVNAPGKLQAFFAR